MNNLRQQFVALAAALLLVAQFSSLAHAVDHPFHAQDDSCVIYLNFEHHVLDQFSADLQVDSITASGNYDRLPDSQPYHKLSSQYYARAPPLHF